MDTIERRAFDGLPPNFPEWMAWFTHLIDRRFERLTDAMARASWGKD